MQPRTFFEECLNDLSKNPHRVFSIDDAGKLKGDPRYQAFCSQYKRFNLVRDAFDGKEAIEFYEKDDASIAPCNAFVRWMALQGGSLNVKSLTGQELSQAIIHTNYLLHSFAPQHMDRSSIAPDMDLQKITNLNTCLYDIRQELAERQNVQSSFALRTISQPKSAMWILGDQYKNISSMTWDQSGQYLLCLAQKDGNQFVLAYEYDARELSLKKCLEMHLKIDGMPNFLATYLVWGPAEQVFVLGGQTKDGKKAAAFLYSFNSEKKIASQLQEIHKIPAYDGISHQAFWFADTSHLSIVHAGECFIFAWDPVALRFTLEDRIYPGLQHVTSASISCDQQSFLTSHSEYPYIRISKNGAPFGAYSVAHFKDKLLDAQWHPRQFYFVARSQLESDVVILYQYNPLTEKVSLMQRMHVGSSVSSMKWSEDGENLFVVAEPSLLCGAGLRVYSFSDGALAVADSIDSQVAGSLCVSDFAFSTRRRVLVVAGKPQNFFSGLIMPFLAHEKKTSLAEKDDVCRGVSLSVSVDGAVESSKSIYHTLHDIPNQKDIVFGSLIMLVNPRDPSSSLAACDAPELRLTHNGKAFPCVKKLRSQDLSGENLSCWWAVEGESWLERVGSLVTPQARISLRNMATGELLGVTQTHAPIHGIALDSLFVSLSSVEQFLAIRRPYDITAPWSLGEGVQLVMDESVIGIDVAQPERHPILSNMGIARLMLEPLKSQIARGLDASSFWAVSRNISLKTVARQSLLGSECCEHLFRKVNKVLSKDAATAVKRSIESDQRVVAL